MGRPDKQSRGVEMMKTTPGAILECTVSHQHRAKKKRPLENFLVPNSLGKKKFLVSPLIKNRSMAA